LAKVFLKLGTTAFGGPAAHIALMRDEVVRRRQWLTEQQFLDLVGATNLIPGPNSTEMAIHIGHARAGWRGLLVAGSCFILPATLIVGGIAWAYDGVNVASMALMVVVTWHLGSGALVDPLTISVAVISGVLLLWDRVNSGWLILAGGVLGLVVGS
jgi:chromate transporter